MASGGTRRGCLSFLESLLGSGKCITLTCVAKVLPVGGCKARSTLGVFSRFSVVSPKPLTRCIKFARRRMDRLYRQCNVSVRRLGD